MSQETPPREVKCNCFPELLHVKVKGEFLVRNGEVTPILEVDSKGPSDDEYWEYTVYTPLDENGDEVTL